MSTAVTKQNKTAKDLIKDYQPEFRKLLPKGTPSELFTRTALTIMNNPKLQECTTQSVINCLLKLAPSGLTPDGYNAHLIPYGKECTLIIDYKGLIKLGKKHGGIQTWQGYKICANDEFSWNDGIMKHSIDVKKPRGEAIAYYSKVVYKDGSVDCDEPMTRDEIDKIRKRSKASGSGPWVTDYDEMAKKTVVRRHSKRIDISPEYMQALAADDDKLPEMEIPRNEIDISEAIPVKKEEPAAQPAPQQERQAERGDANEDDLPSDPPPATVSRPAAVKKAGKDMFGA